MRLQKERKRFFHLHERQLYPLYDQGAATGLALSAQR